MAETTFTQATLDQIELVIAQAISTPKEAVKGAINLDDGGQIVYRSWNELLEMRKTIKEILDTESNIDFDSAKKSAYKPFSQAVWYRGNL